MTAMDNPSDLNEIWSVFGEETRENLDLVESCLLNLSAHPDDRELREKPAGAEIRVSPSPKEGSSFSRSTRRGRETSFDRGEGISPEDV